MNPTFLIDTNIIIQFEDTDDTNQIKPLFSRLHSQFVKHGLKHFYHPSSELDFESDQKESRKVQNLSRLRKYPKLESPPTIAKDELESLFGGISKSNDLIDCQILYALKRNCVTFLVSEDNGIRKRARNAGLEERVLNCNESITLIEKNFDKKIIEHPRIQNEYCYNLRLEDNIFNTLRADYDGFDKWFREKCCQTQRMCWTIKSENSIGGICIYNPEDYKDLPRPGIKLCTFKIATEKEGRKYGELLLKAAFNHAIKNKIKTIWLTTYSKQEKLIHFLKTFGFRVHSELKGDEMVFYKEMQPSKGVGEMPALDFHIRYSPHFYDKKNIKKYFIPIQPNFYYSLYPERSGQQLLHLSGGDDGPAIPGNTIRKVYLCHSNIKGLDSGSLFYFYVSAPNSSIETLCIVEKTERFNSEESLSGAIGKRSVYSLEQIKEMIKKEVIVISFRTISHFSPISLNEMKVLKIARAAPQTIGEIDNITYSKIQKIIEFES